MGTGNRQQWSRRWRRWRKRYGPEVLHRYRFSSTPQVNSADWDDVTLTELTPVLLERMVKRYPRELSARKRAILEARIGNPAETCWAILRAGRPAGYCNAAWTTTVNERIHHPVRLGRDEVYLFDSYVFKRHRGHRLHRYAIAKRLEIAAACGRSAGVTIISAKNAPSQASFVPFGASRTHTLLYLPPIRRTLEWRTRRSR